MPMSREGTLRMKIYKPGEVNGSLRQYRQSDRRSLLEIFRLNTPLYFDLIQQKHFSEYLANHATTYFVITGKKIIGGGGYHLSEDLQIGRLSWNLIHPDYRYRWFGTRITSHCLDLMKTHGSLRLIKVCTSQFAYQFYGRFGFQVVEIKRDFWGQGLDLYKMEMIVTGTDLLPQE